MYALEKKPRGWFSRDARAAHALYSGSLAPALLVIQRLKRTFLLDFRALWAAARTPAHREPRLTPKPSQQQRMRSAAAAAGHLWNFYRRTARSVAPRRRWEVFCFRQTHFGSEAPPWLWTVGSFTFLSDRNILVLVFSLHSTETAGASIDVILVELVLNSWCDVTFPSFGCFKCNQLSLNNGLSTHKSMNQFKVVLGQEIVFLLVLMYIYLTN